MVLSKRFFTFIITGIIAVKDVIQRFYHSERLFVFFNGKVLAEFRKITIDKLFSEYFDGKRMPNRLRRSVPSAYGVSLNGCVEQFLPSEKRFGVNVMVKKNVY